jgi:hypothetical protein
VYKRFPDLHTGRPTGTRSVCRASAFVQTPATEVSLGRTPAIAVAMFVNHDNLGLPSFLFDWRSQHPVVQFLQTLELIHPLIEG